MRSFSLYGIIAENVVIKPEKSQQKKMRDKAPDILTALKLGWTLSIEQDQSRTFLLKRDRQ